MNAFQQYVNKNTFLGSYSARKTVTIAARFLQASLSRNVISDISGSTVFKALENAADDGYFQEKRIVYSASYLRKITISLKRFLELLLKDFNKIKISHALFEQSTQNLTSSHKVP